MERKTLTPDISVSGQITPADVATLAEQGVRSIINNRPEGESADQPSLDALKQAAAEQGIEFRSIPFASGRQTPNDIAAFAEALEQMPAPMHVYCRSGMRSASIWAMAQADKQPADDLLKAAAAAGYDLAPIRPVLVALGGR